MMILIRIIGIFITAMGLAILLSPQKAKGMMAFWRKGSNLYIAGLIRLTLGLIFLYYAPIARVPELMFALGILALLGGALIFILGLEKAKAMLEKVQNKPDNFLRLLSLLILAFGVLILYSV